MNILRTSGIASMLLMLFFLLAFNKKSDEGIVSYTVDLQKERVTMHWRGANHKPLQSLDNLLAQLTAENKEVHFLMNAGMYDASYAPVGLYIENKVLMHKVNRVQQAAGNFYMQPNGVFAISINNRPVLVPTEQYALADTIAFATQSGPMLVLDGKINSLFAPKSVNTNIRNGVGILPNGKILFAMSKEEVTFYEFASYFKRLGCKYALYLDGAISRAYCPSCSWPQKGGAFGVMISVCAK